MNIKTNFTSKDVLNNPEDTQIAFSSFDYVTYTLTESELGWLEFVKGRYSIADYLLSVLEVNEDKQSIVKLNAYDFSIALDEDCNTLGKAVCLSDDTALQAIFFYNYIEGLDINE